MLHLSIGSIIPTGISWIFSFFHADLFKTYDVPKIDQLLQSKISKEGYFKQVKKTWKKTTNNSFKLLTINYSIQLILCSFILYTQQKQFVENVLPLKFSIEEINKIKQ